jgi:hypothetical protein
MSRRPGHRPAGRGRRSGEPLRLTVGGAGAGEARVPVAAPRLAQDLATGGPHDPGAAVRRAVVHEDRVVQQAEITELRQQRRQGLRLVEHRHDDAVLWAV